MNKKIIVMNVALMVVFVLVALIMFTENVRTVQIVGLLACGAIIGAALSAIISAFKSKKT